MNQDVNDEIEIDRGCLGGQHVQGPQGSRNEHVSWSWHMQRS